jgi:hypothetical protein
MAAYPLLRACNNQTRQMSFDTLDRREEEHRQVSWGGNGVRLEATLLVVITIMKGSEVRVKDHPKSRLHGIDACVVQSFFDFSWVSSTMC